MATTPASTKQADPPAKKAPKRRIAPATLALGGAGIVALAALVIATTRSGGEVPAPTPAPAAAASSEGPEEKIARMQAALAADPDNHEGWFLLGLELKGGGYFADAQAAFRRAVQLRPDAPAYQAGLAEMLLVNGRGETDREAEELLRKAHATDREMPAPRYYLAILKDQRGQHREAVDDLISLLGDVPATGAPWEEPVRSAIERIARANRIDIAGRVPERRTPAAAPSAATAAIPGPTQEQLDAAKGMTPTQQDAAARGMVDRLAERLRQNPRDEDRWMMMMRSRLHLNEPQRAAEALRTALAAFADDPAAQQRLRAAAVELGIPQG